MLYIIIAAAGIFSTLHFYGFKRFLKIFLIPDNTPKKARPAPAPKPKPPRKTSPPEPVQIDREFLERVVQNIKTGAGFRGDIVTITENATDAELIEIINNWYNTD